MQQADLFGHDVEPGEEPASRFLAMDHALEVRLTSVPYAVAVGRMRLEKARRTEPHAVLECGACLGSELPVMLEQVSREIFRQMVVHVPRNPHAFITLYQQMAENMQTPQRRFEGRTAGHPDLAGVGVVFHLAEHETADTVPG